MHTLANKIEELEFNLKELENNNYKTKKNDKFIYKKILFTLQELKTLKMIYEVVELYENNDFSFRELSSHLKANGHNISHVTIAKYCKEYSKKFKELEEQKKKRNDEIITLYNEGYTNLMIGNKVMLSESQVSRIVNAYILLQNKEKAENIKKQHLTTLKTTRRK